MPPGDLTRRFEGDAAANAQLAAAVRLDSVSQADFDTCHAPGVLRHVKTPDGRPLVEGKKVAGFTNTEEAAQGLTDVVPFLVEDELKAKGGIYSKVDDWAPYVVSYGLLITGQNPASSAPAAATLLEQLAAGAK